MTQSHAVPPRKYEVRLCVGGQPLRLGRIVTLIRTSSASMRKMKSSALIIVTYRPLDIFPISSAVRVTLPCVNCITLCWKLVLCNSLAKREIRISRVRAKLDQSLGAHFLHHPPAEWHVTDPRGRLDDSFRDKAYVFHLDFSILFSSDSKSPRSPPPQVGCVFQRRLFFEDPICSLTEA